MTHILFNADLAPKKAPKGIDQINAHFSQTGSTPVDMAKINTGDVSSSLITAVSSKGSEQGDSDPDYALSPQPSCPWAWKWGGGEEGERKRFRKRKENKSMRIDRQRQGLRSASPVALK